MNNTGNNDSVFNFRARLACLARVMRMSIFPYKDFQTSKVKKNSLVTWQVKAGEHIIVLYAHLHNIQRLTEKYA